MLSSAGQAVWPPLTSVKRPAAGSGVTASHITLIKRPGGASQVAYNGHLLYTFLDDHAGQVTGQGVQGFFVATPGLAPLAGSPATPGTAVPASSGNGYGY